MAARRDLAWVVCGVARTAVSIAADLGFALAVGFLIPVPAAAYNPDHNILAVRVESVEDANGDRDGQLDTNETVVLVLSLSNKTRVATANFDLRLSPLDGKIDAIDPFLLHVAHLGPGATLTLPPVLVHVSAAASRAGTGVTCQNPGPSGTCSNFAPTPGGCATDPDCQLAATASYAVGIRVEVLGGSTQPFASYPEYALPFVGIPDRVVFDLDLNSSHPSLVTTSYAEGFEAGLGSFELLNLDVNLASNTASDGRRCQYHDPDYVNSNSYGNTECYLGFAAGQNPVNDWHSHSTIYAGGRAYSGIRSLHWGLHPTPADAGADTYGLSQMDAVRSKVVLNLAARVCRDDPAPSPRACSSDADCLGTGGGPCSPAQPALSFKHQVSFIDDRGTATRSGTATDRGAVAAKPEGSFTWEKVFPFANVYDVQGTQDFVNCTFDPIDDGSSEADYFEPADPQRRFGPSTTCFPEFVFSLLGDTDAPFSPTEIGKASDGPGLQGSLGLGTWVESRFDLSRYRGRSIRIRFLATSIKAADLPTAEAVFMWNPSPLDDGWWVDEVRVSQTLGSTTPTVTTDGTDNGSLPGAADADADGHPDAFDCAPADAGAFLAPVEVLGLRAAADKVTQRWESALPFVGAATVHDLRRGNLGEWPVGAGAGETCVAIGVAADAAADVAVPAPGSGFWYLVRARNACGTGVAGYDSTGSPRTAVACP